MYSYKYETAQIKSANLYSFITRKTEKEKRLAAIRAIIDNNTTIKGK